jgi:hypothetical protein
MLLTKASLLYNRSVCALRIRTHSLGTTLHTIDGMCARLWGAMRNLIETVTELLGQFTSLQGMEKLVTMTATNPE